MGGLLAAGQPDYAAGCAWNLGWAGWTLGPEAGWRVAGWAGPEASRRHVRHASRRAEGQGLRLVFRLASQTARPEASLRHVRQT